MNYIKAIDENRTSINRVNMAYLQKKHNAKLKTKLEIYEKILNRIYNRIDIASNVDNTLCVFDIPEYIYGFPIYNIPACADYLTRKLIHNGFHVKFIKPNILYISWKYNSSINCISPLMNVPYTPEIAYPDAMEPKQTSLHALPEPPLPDYDKPAVKNIPLPPMNFQYTGNHEMLSLMPPPNRAPNGSSYEPKSYEIPQSQSQPKPRQISYDQPSQQYKQFQISLSERPEPKSKSQKNYKSTEEYRPSGKFLYHNHK
jgi:hypothetical protein